MIGAKFGLLTVSADGGRDKWNKRLWHCACECGGNHIVRGSNLKGGRVKSCGCLAGSGRKIEQRKHSKRIRKIWDGMRSRCRDESNPSFRWYGLRGISVCQEWESFSAFYNWALSAGYDHSLTLDRVDNNKGYSPENCRWVSVVVQGRNRRSVKLSEEKVSAIRADARPRSILAKIYDVSPRQISRVRAGVSWQI